MKILISGAGLAGLATAYWLRQHGHEPIVIEKAPDLRRDGYGLDFFGAGYDVAERMAIVDQLADRQIFLEESSTIGFVNDKGNLQAALELDEVRRILGGKYMGLMHYSLEEVLYDSVKNDVEIRFGSSIACVSQSSDSVAVTFEYGASEQFDNVVGADGIHSNVRSLVFGPESEYAYYMGYYFACYYVPDQYQLPSVWTNYTEPGLQIGVYKTDRPGQLATLLIWQAEDEGHIAHDQRADKIRSAFGNMGWLAPELLDAMPSDGADILIDTVTQIRMDNWRNDRVVLVGDAAGCMTLISGQGASMALAGAYVLAEELGKTDDWRQAMANYEHRVRPQIELRQEKAHDFAKRFVPDSELGIKVQTVFMKLVTFQAFSGLLKSQFVGESFLQTAALERLPDSHENILGYQVSGKLQPTDYQTLALSIDEVLQQTSTVNLLLQIEGLTEVELDAWWTDWRFGRQYHNKISKLAIAGDSRVSKWVARLSEPLYAKEARHFTMEELDKAWAWLET